MKKFVLELDKKVLYYFQSINNPTLDLFMKFVAHSGDLNVIYILLGIWFYLTKRLPLSFRIIIATVVVLIVCNILFKNLAKRARPYETYSNINVKIFPKPNDYSMPSGHTTMAFAIATVLFGSVWIYTAFIWAILMGIARMYVGVHYLSDVLVGTILGIIIGIIQLLIIL